MSAISLDFWVPHVVRVKSNYFAHESRYLYLHVKYGACDFLCNLRVLLRFWQTRDMAWTLDIVHILLY